MSETKQRIKSFLSQETDVDLETVGDEEALFTSGLIDSYSLIELLSFLESELGFEVDFGELNVDDFDTIQALTNLVDAK
ncbi:acyl carrier protein [Alteromonadaceae bacterium 2753L.S.0a.02]|nr:acyl carrier protein [Alteromonadaceae bacterium 2753L.S.0a.02]